MREAALRGQLFATTSFTDLKEFVVEGPWWRKAAYSILYDIDKGPV